MLWTVATYGRDYDWATDGSDAVLPSAVRLLAIPVPVQPEGVSTLVLTAKTGWARRVQHPRKCGSNTCISGSGSAIADGVTAATVGVVWRRYQWCRGDWR